MNRTDIIKAFYEVIKDSAEWSGVCEGKEYAQFVDGAAAMVEKMTDMYCNMPWEDEDLRACYPEAGRCNTASDSVYTEKPKTLSDSPYAKRPPVVCTIDE